MQHCPVVVLTQYLIQFMGYLSYTKDVLYMYEYEESILKKEAYYVMA